MCASLAAAGATGSATARPSPRSRAVNERHVLACGPRNSLLLYDLRFCTAPTPTPCGGRSAPLLAFPGYRNKEHVHIGFDVAVSPSTFPTGGSSGCGVVAAAHDDGRVGLYSLLDGGRLRCPALDTYQAVAGPVETPCFRSSAARYHELVSRAGGEHREVLIGTLFLNSEE